MRTQRRPDQVLSAGECACTAVLGVRGTQNAVPPERRTDLAVVRTDACEEPLVTREMHDRLGHLRVVGHEEAVRPVHDELLDPGAAARHDREPCGPGLEGCDAERLELGGSEEHVRVGVGGPDLLA